MTSDPNHSTGVITIAIEADGWAGALVDPEALVIRAVEAALAAACPRLGEAGISLLLTDDQSQQALNKEWRGHDKPTNVLSFPATETREGETPQPEFVGVPLELGDIALAFETCAREAAEQDKPLAHHVEHLVVHGVLHLLGYDHLEDDQAERMERLETRILAGLDVPDPYAAGPNSAIRLGDG
jgi:probable rRNA maturation factor